MRWVLQIKISVNVDGVICSAVPYWAFIVKRYGKPQRKLKLVKAIWLMQRGWGGPCVGVGSKNICFVATAVPH